MSILLLKRSFILSKVEKSLQWDHVFNITQTPSTTFYTQFSMTGATPDVRQKLEGWKKMPAERYQINDKTDWAIAKRCYNVRWLCSND